MSDKTLVDTLLFLQSDLNEAKKLKLESRMELKKELLNLVKDEIYLRMKKAG